MQITAFIIDAILDFSSSDLLVITTGLLPPITNPPAVAFAKCTRDFTSAFPVSIFGTIITLAFPGTFPSVPFIFADSCEIALSKAKGPSTGVSE